LLLSFGRYGRESLLDSHSLGSYISRHTLAITLFLS
jgi:hypothetical protein